MNTNEKNKSLDKLRIGQIAMVEKWLNKFGMPYRAENIKRITDDAGYTKAFEVLLDKEIMQTEYEELIPEFLKSGKVTLIITLKS